MEIVKDIVVPLVVALIGLIPAFIQLMQKREQKRLKGATGKSSKLMSSMVIAGLIPSCFIVVYLFISFFSKEDIPKIDISQPSSGEIVYPLQDVRGTYEGLPADYTIWIATYSETDGLYYPHPARATMYAKGIWSAEKVSVGTESDHQKQFSILVVIADKIATNEFENYCNKPERAGLKSLPAGTRVSDEIKVTRK